jgi:hypothetical protein
MEGRKVRILCLGDDQCGSIIVPDEFAHLDIFDLYCKAHTQLFGVDMTWGTKTNQGQLVDSIFDISFLSRRFISYKSSSPQRPHIIKGALKNESIKSLLIHTRYMTQDQIFENWLNALVEARLHGAEFYVAAKNTIVVIFNCLMNSPLQLSAPAFMETMTKAYTRMQELDEEHHSGATSWTRYFPSYECVIPDCYCDSEFCITNLEDMSEEIRTAFSVDDEVLEFLPSPKLLDAPIPSGANDEVFIYNAKEPFIQKPCILKIISKTNIIYPIADKTINSSSEDKQLNLKLKLTRD